MQQQRWIRRSRVQYAVAMAAVIVVGLATRHTSWLPPWVAKSAGDALWALCAFLAIGWLAPAAPPRRVAVVTLAFAYCVEFSQLYHAPWLDAIRHLRPGILLLGSSFAWPDLAYYTAGIAAGWLAERWWLGMATQGSDADTPQRQRLPAPHGLDPRDAG